MLIATAGHIDHGKTALVRALTGTATDRLPEEKRRGISIDLGFAYWRPADGELIGFVDVPGHERYVRNMLAGLAGADFALLVVAADDGVMPQTIEHLRMLDFMGLTRGLVALTKCDKVDAARQSAVREELRSLLAGTGLAQAQILAVSSQTGDGIPELAQALRNAASAAQAGDSRALRFVIDRCFTASGAGTVVTGTVLGGTLQSGDHLILSPMGLPVRVRGLQSDGLAIESVRTGQRCAANLAGADVQQVHRGDWLLHPALHAPTSRADVRVQVLPALETPLRHGAAVRLYLGAAEIPARMFSRRQMPIAPGESRIVALAFDRPACAFNGDRFVLRDASGRTLIGGGRVLDPFAPPRFRRDDGREVLLAALELHEPRASLAAMLASETLEIGRSWFEQSFGLHAGETEAFCAETGACTIGKARPVLLSGQRAAALKEAILRILAQSHAERPESGGMTAREVGKALASALSAEPLAALLRELASDQAIEFAGPLVRLPGHRPSFSAAEAAQWQAMLDWLEDSPPRTVTPAELAQELGDGESALRAMLFRRRIAGDLWAITDSRFMLPAHVDALAASAALLALRHPEGFTAAQFRDATGLGRNHVIRLLEFFDRVGVSKRCGERRIMLADWQSLVGPAEPWLAGEAPRPSPMPPTQVR